MRKRREKRRQKFPKYFAENFELFGLKKLISTNFAFNSKKLSQACLPGFEKLTSDAIRQLPRHEKRRFPLDARTGIDWLDDWID